MRVQTQTQEEEAEAEAGSQDAAVVEKSEEAQNSPPFRRRTAGQQSA